MSTIDRLTPPEPTLDRAAPPDPAIDRRFDSRLPLRLPVELRRQREGRAHIVRTLTQNVSTGGLYFELDEREFQPGDRFDVEITIPPSDGVSPYEGRAHGPAEVLRVAETGRATRFGVAAKFLDRLRLSY